MENRLANLLIIVFSLCPLLLQPAQTQRIRRHNGPAIATANNSSSSSSSSCNITATTIDLTPGARPDQKATAAACGTAAKDAATSTAGTSSTAMPPTASPAADQDFDFEVPLFRSKQRVLLDESPHHVHRHTLAPPAQAGPPYVYYNKLMSPDGRQELKQFQLMAPNVFIESVQQDMNYGPAADVGRVLLLNDRLDGGHLRPVADKPAKHHHKHKSSAMAVPPFLLLLQRMLQPDLSMEVDPSQRNRLDAPLYQVIDGDVDNAMRGSGSGSSSREAFEREFELNDNREKFRERDENDLLALELADRKGPQHKDELIVTCPIRHEHRANINGELVDNDVVLINECHVG